MSSRRITTLMLVLPAALLGCSDPARPSAAEYTAGAGTLSAGSGGTGEQLSASWFGRRLSRRARSSTRANDPQPPHCRSLPRRR